jgi:type IV secretory pathway TrbL component
MKEFFRNFINAIESRWHGIESKVAWLLIILLVIAFVLKVI